MSTPATPRMTQNVYIRGRCLVYLGIDIGIGIAIGIGISLGIGLGIGHGTGLGLRGGSCRAAAGGPPERHRSAAGVRIYALSWPCLGRALSFPCLGLVMAEAVECHGIVLALSWPQP
jgi:hypothetical protein